MSAPERMLCLLDECRSPLACSHAGRCSARAEDGARSYDLAIRSLRDQMR